ncbi:MAG: hypothetical protein A2001_17925 [Treponema sp. GWC1_61_84]|nr:MAG: hypothetical protein A2001_17925 [Treponema sp. GWC1_61_84]
MTFPPRGPSLLVFAILMIPCFSACDLISAKPDEASEDGAPVEDSGAQARPEALTGLQVTDGGALRAEISWSAPDAGTVRVLVALLPPDDLWTPIDGVIHTVGETAGGGCIVWSGTGTYTMVSDLAIGTECRFVAFAVNSGLRYSNPAEVAFIVPEPAPKFAGFDFSLAEGDYWEYRYYYSIYADWGNTNWSYTRNFVVMLGAPSTIGGRTAYPLTLQSVALCFEPRWKWLALDDSVLYGSLYSGAGAPESATWTPILDAKTGYWKGGGFFVTRGDEDYSMAKTGVEVLEGVATSIVTIGSGSTCSAEYTYVPDYGYVASGEDIFSNTAEYFIPEVGPGGYNEAFALSSSYYQSSERESVTLVASSRTSAVPLDFKATYRYSFSSTGESLAVAVGPGLAGMKRAALLGSSTDTPFLIGGTARENLYGLLAANAADWTVAASSRDVSPDGLTGLIDLGGFIKTGSSYEGVTIISDGGTYAVASGAASFQMIKDAILALAP